MISHAAIRTHEENRGIAGELLCCRSTKRMAATKTFCMCHKKTCSIPRSVGTLGSNLAPRYKTGFVPFRAAPVGAPDVWSFLTKICQFSGRNKNVLHPIFSCQDLPGNGLLGRSLRTMNGIRIVCFGQIFSSLRMCWDPRIFSRGCFPLPCPPISREGDASDTLVNERPCSIIPAIFFHGYTADHPTVILPVNKILLPH